MKRLPFFRRPPVLAPLEQKDAAALRNLHQQSFPHAWDEAAFRNFLAEPQVIGFGARRPGRDTALSGFILARFIGDEAEILTFAVAESARRRGLGRALLEHLLRFLYQERVKALFLEVDEHNAAALALYRALNFKETGRRKAYYQAAVPTAAKPQAQNAADHSPAALGRSDALLFEYRYRHDYKTSQNR